MPRDPSNEVTKWQRSIWYGAGLGLALTIAVLVWFMSSTVTEVVRIIAAQKNPDLVFVFASTSMVTLSLLRLLAIVVGAAIAFAGLAVSFFTHEKATTITGETGSQDGSKTAAALATHSPGIAAVVVGSVIIAIALLAKSSHTYEGPHVYQLSVPSPQSTGAGTASRTELGPEPKSRAELYAPIASGARK